ncbi:hypothetical protein E2C01_093025 [Portunus trituberculatus]|uniref:Uncharacterized protein n=1 Tax=Portunus trituberculatus TaxID=210409 RepID=A0A5B7JXJ0_PORTR|nr:hypothetical protein [Portunus trituberculatus]
MPLRKGRMMVPLALHGAGSGHVNSAPPPMNQRTEPLLNPCLSAARHNEAGMFGMRVWAARRDLWPMQGDFFFPCRYTLWLYVWQGMSPSLHNKEKIIEEKKEEKEKEEKVEDETNEG